MVSPYIFNKRDPAKDAALSTDRSFLSVFDRDIPLPVPVRGTLIVAEITCLGDFAGARIGVFRPRVSDEENPHRP